MNTGSAGLNIMAVHLSVLLRDPALQALLFVLNILFFSLAPTLVPGSGGGTSVDSGRATTTASSGSLVDMVVDQRFHVDILITILRIVIAIIVIADVVVGCFATTTSSGSGSLASILSRRRLSGTLARSSRALDRSTAAVSFGTGLDIVQAMRYGLWGTVYEGPC
jgi:uncharacterized membrane protein